MDSDVGQLPEPYRANVCLSSAILVNSHHSAEIQICLTAFSFFVKKHQIKKKKRKYLGRILTVGSSLCNKDIDGMATQRKSGLKNRS